MINYDEKWVNSTYKNCKTKGLLVSDKITIEELRNKVYDIVNVNRNEYEIAMLEAKNPGTITHIETDSNNHFIYFFHVT